MTGRWKKGQEAGREGADEGELCGRIRGKRGGTIHHPPYFAAEVVQDWLLTNHASSPFEQSGWIWSS